MSNKLKNMKKIAFIVDTSSSVKVNEFKDVYVLPLTINVTNTKTNEIKSYHDTVDITNKDVAKFLSDKNCTITTSQSSTGEIINLVEKIYDKYDEIYVLPIPLYLSGSANTWNLIAKEYDKLIVGIENKEIADGIKWCIKDLLEMAKKGTLTPTTFKEYLLKQQEIEAGVLFVSDITQLAKGGRVSNLKSLILKILKLNIVITCDKNGLNFFKTTKGLTKGFDATIEEYKKRVPGFSLDKIKKLCFQFGTKNENNPDIIELINYIKSVIPKDCKIETGYISNVILAHTGDNAIIIKIGI